MNATWIVSANAGRARFFSQAGATEPLVEINDMVNSAVRLREVETESDKVGPTAATKSIHNVGGALPNKQYEPHQTPDERQTEMFARDVANFLKQSQQEGRFNKLSLVASPQFLGVLRQQLPSNVESLVEVTINKDYTQFSAEQLQEQIRTHSQKS